MTDVLFVCIGNSGRSVMAERLFAGAADGRHRARSAGASPHGPTEPDVVEVLAELGIDASDHVPRKLDVEAIDWADVIVAACDGACPVVPGKRYIGWSISDPHGQPVEGVRQIRDEIRGLVEALVAELDSETE